MIDYSAIRGSVQSIILAGTFTDSIKEVLIEPMERDMLLANMPMISIRLTNANIQVRSLPNGYYAYVAFAIDVTTFDLSEFKKAAIVRDRILKELQIILQRNRQFTVGVETSSVGPRVEFTAGIAEEGEIVRGHIASATFDFIVEVSIEPA